LQLDTIGANSGSKFLRSTMSSSSKLHPNRHSLQQGKVRPVLLATVVLALAAAGGGMRKNRVQAAIRLRLQLLSRERAGPVHAQGAMVAQGRAAPAALAA